MFQKLRHVSFSMKTIVIFSLIPASLFDVLKPKAPAPKTATNPQKSHILSPISNNKKRKSTDFFLNNQKGTKLIRNDECVAKAKRLKVDEGENEVSSSSEPDASKNPPLATKENNPGIKQHKVSGSLDRFVRTTQAREVSTSCTDESTVDLTEDDGEKSQEPEQSVPDSSQDKEEGNETRQTKVAGSLDRFFTTGKKDCLVPEQKNADRQDETKDLNQSISSHKCDTEESMEVDSVLDASVATDDANKSLDSTVSDADSPKEKTSKADEKTDGTTTPISRRAKKAVSAKPVADSKLLVNNYFNMNRK